MDYKIIDAHAHLWLKQDAVWNGKAQVAMREKFDEKRATFKQFGEEIESYAADMAALRDDIAQRDQELASRIANNM